MVTDVGQTDRELWACRAERERERAVEGGQPGQAGQTGSNNNNKTGGAELSPE